MDDKRFSLRVSRSMFSFGLQFLLYEKDFNNKMVSLATSITLETVQDTKDLRVEPTFELQDCAVQELMNELWVNGFRPSEGVASTGALGATKEHLKDMRTLVSKCMKVELK